MKTILSKPLFLVLAVLLAIALILSGVLVYRSLTDPLDCRMAADVKIGGLDVSGKTWLEAWRSVGTAAKETLLAEAMEVSLPGDTVTVSPKEAGVKVSAWKAVNDAYRIGRKEAAQETNLPLSHYISWNEAYVRSLLETYASQYNTDLTQPSWKLRGLVPELGTDAFDPSAPGQTVELTLGLPKRHMDVDATMQQILQGYNESLAGVEKLALDVEPSQLPQEPNLQEIYDTCYLSPKDDALDMATYQVIPGSYGYAFDLEAAQALVDQAPYGETVSIPMEPVEPEIFGEGVYFRDVLGSCETKHTTDENRNTNLRLLCGFLDGVVIQPGEEFSYNQAVGERTEERGFKPATVFAGDRKAKDFGGGVCQGSSTLYNCLLIADMEITKRHGHGALVTYIPLGLDAAVNWSTDTDLRFINNSHFPVKIQAKVSDGYVKMKLLGTDEKDYYIKMEAKQYQEGDYYYATSYKCKYDKKTDELISRDREAFSSYIAELPS